MPEKKTRTELSSIVLYICHAARGLSAALLVVAVLARLLLSPGEVERGVYLFVIVLNALIFLGSILLDRFMQRSARDLQKKARAPQEDEGAGIEGWLAKKDEEKGE